MKLKTLLLGSAAAFAVAGAAQAADLSVAEPVAYVKVCDAFGTGYWYIPGTDTCLKIGGYVRFDVNFHSSTATLGDHSSSWDMTTEGRVNVTASSMTEYGALTGYVDLRGKVNPNSSSNANFYVHDAYLSLGMLLVGYTGSIYDYGAGHTYGGANYDPDSARKTQVRLSWAMSGFGVQLAIEDPRQRWGSSMSSSFSMPDIVGDISFSQGNWSGKISAGFAETTAGSGFGVMGGMTFKLDSIAPGDNLAVSASWAEAQVALFGSSQGIVVPTGSVWSFLASFQHFWTPTLSSAVDFDYYSQTGSTYSPTYVNSNGWEIFGNLVWAPVSGFSAGIDVGYAKINTTSGVWKAKIRLERDW
jgi:hypothetical protein